MKISFLGLAGTMGCGSMLPVLDKDRRRFDRAVGHWDGSTRAEEICAMLPAPINLAASLGGPERAAKLAD
jgi:hypothetical protein